jgi:hypothetical protein
MQRFNRPAFVLLVLTSSTAVAVAFAVFWVIIATKHKHCEQENSEGCDVVAPGLITFIGNLSHMAMWAITLLMTFHIYIVYFMWTVH